MTRSAPIQISSKFIRLVQIGLCGTLCGILFTSVASATLWVRVSDQNLVQQTIDRGGVIALVEAGDWSPALASSIPSTDQHMVVREVIHGDLAADTLTVRWLGGQAADGYSLKIEGVETLPRQSTAILFLRPGADGTWRALHLFQGVFHTVNHEGVDYAYRSLGGTELSLAGDKLTVEAERARELEPFIAWIRSRSEGRPTAAAYWSDVSLAELRATFESKNYAKFNLLSDLIRFRQFDSNQSVSWRAHQAGQSGLAGGGFSEFQGAIAAWNNDPGSNVRYTYAGTTGNSTGFKGFDGVNTIVFDNLDDADDGEFDEPFNCFQGGTIAIGGPWFDLNQTHQYNGVTFRTSFGGDIVTNENTGCILGNPQTARETFAHELGHTLGLSHSCGDDSSGSCFGRPVQDDALMRAQVHQDGRGARLTADDRAGIKTLYASAATLPPDAPSGLSASNGGLGLVNLGWNDNSNNESGFQVERRIGSGNFSQIGSTGANARSFTDSAAPTGSSLTYRVRAFNSAGSSAYTNNAGVATTGPTPPTDVMVTALSSGTLRVDWIDNTLDETGFEIQMRREGTEFSFAKLRTTAADATTTAIDELFTDSGFEFRIRALTEAGASSWSETASGSTLPYAVGDPCVPGDATLCLTGGRYQNRVLWRNFKDEAGLGQRIATEQSTDSGLLWFFGANNWEMLVKNLDACTINERVWVLAAATTNVEYTLQVVDTWTGEAVSYFNPLGTAAPAVIDIDAFKDSCAAPSPFEAPQEASFLLPTDKVDGCQPVITGSDTTLFLNDGRFEVEVDWMKFNGQSGPGTVVEFCSTDSGLFWFFGKNNWELLIKVLDACTLNEHFWVFAAATTNVEYTLRVTDTESGITNTYFNPLGQRSIAVTDTSAFATCP